MALFNCPECGNQISDKAISCPKCGYSLSSFNPMTTLASPLQQKSCKNENKVVVINNREKSNGCATSGFVFAILGLLLGWVPVLGWALWFLGLVLCFFGLFSSPRTMAIVGLIITFIDFFIIMAVVGGIASVLSSLSNL